MEYKMETKVVLTVEVHAAILLPVASVQLLTVKMEESVSPIQQTNTATIATARQDFPDTTVIQVRTF